MLGCDADVALLDSFDGAVGEGLNFDEPLRGKARLDDGLAAVAVADVVGVVLDGCEEALGFEVGDDLLSGDIAIKAGVGAAFRVDVAGVVHDVDRWKMVALAQSKIVGVVRRGHLDGAGAEVAADPFIENDGNLTGDERQAEFFPAQMKVALVFRMNGYGYVAEHGLGAGGRNGQKLARILSVCGEHRIINLPQMALVLVVNHFEVADGGLAPGTPVDDVCAAIDEALLVEADEGFPHCDGKMIVHGEVLALPVDGCAEALHLVEDGAAVVAFPLPNARFKCLAAKLLAGRAFRGELAFDHQLRGDAGVVGAGYPQGAEAGHAPPADHDIDLRLLEHVSHVELARDVGRGQEDRKGLAGRADARFARKSWFRRGLGEEVFADPVFGPVIFNGGGVVGFGQVVRHGVCQ